jgi:ABC-type polysaccharide/polyol phosphate export permease
MSSTIVPQRTQTRITRQRSVNYAFELRELFSRWELIKYLTTSTLKSGHRDLVLGHLWWLLEPLMSMMIYVFLVEIIFQRGVPNYAVFVFCAILPYRWFTQAVAQSQGVITTLGSLMRDISFPKSVYPIALTLSNGINFGIGILLLLALAVTHGLYPALTWLWIGPLVLQMGVFALGVSLLLTGLTVFFRDLKNITTFIFHIIFYLSPTLYPIEFVPEKYRALYALNPFAIMFESWRDVLLRGTAPAALPFASVCVLSVVLLVVGYINFVRLEKSFPKIL